MNTIDLAADIGADPAAPNLGAYNLSAGELRNETSGDAYRLLERYGAQMLLAEADDGAQLLYVREEGSAIWQSGYSPVGKWPHMGDAVRVDRRSEHRIRRGAAVRVRADA